MAEYVRDKGPVTQSWTHKLTIMQQSVLIAAVRGPDGIHKNHVSKLLCRWLRRCVLRLAFTDEILTNPVSLGGGSFTGPSVQEHPNRDWQSSMDVVITDYLSTVDEIPHHFQLHFMHAAEILGYKHPDEAIGSWWRHTYYKLANDMHLAPESEAVMDVRLGDNEKSWRKYEEVVAKQPPGTAR